MKLKIVVPALMFIAFPLSISGANQEAKVQQIFQETQTILKRHNKRPDFDAWIQSRDKTYGGKAEADYDKLGELQYQAASLDPAIANFLKVYLSDYDNSQFKSQDRALFVDTITRIAPLIFSSKPLTLLEKRTVAADIESIPQEGKKTASLAKELVQAKLSPATKPTSSEKKPAAREPELETKISHGSQERERFEKISDDFFNGMMNGDIKTMRAAYADAKKSFPSLTAIPEIEKESKLTAFWNHIDLLEQKEKNDTFVNPIQQAVSKNDSKAIARALRALFGQKEQEFLAEQPRIKTKIALLLGKMPEETKKKVTQDIGEDAMGYFLEMPH